MVLTVCRCVSPAAGLWGQGSQEGLAQEKKQLEKRLQDVSGQLNSKNKTDKKKTSKR